MPHTSASIDERKGVLKLLLSQHNAVAWKLLLGLLPHVHQGVLEHRTPHWRYWAEGWKRNVSASDYEQAVGVLIDLAVGELACAPQNWPSVINHFPILESRGIERFVGLLESLKPDALSKTERNSLWHALREFVTRHTYFSDARWALPEDILTRFKTVLEDVAPTESVELAAPLFCGGFNPIGTKDLPWDAQEALRNNRRLAAIKNVLATTGFEGVLALARRVEHTSALGYLLADSTGNDFDASIIPTLLLCEEKPLAAFASAFAARRIQGDITEAKKRPFASWKTEETAVFVALLPFERATWDFVAHFSQPVPVEYWRRLVGWSRHLPAADVEHAVRQFLSVGRVSTAIALMNDTRSDSDRLEPSTVLELLELCIKTPSTEKADQLDGYHVQELLAVLQQTEDVDETRLGTLEWNLLPFLGRHTQLPITLHKLMAREPAFFVQLLCILYKPDTTDDPATPDDATKEKATKAWHLLHDWSRIPGTQNDGSVSVGELGEWAANVRHLAKKEARLEVCDVTLGELLALSPPERDGTWPCTAVRQVIEETDSVELERGFAIGVHNKRGTVSKSVREGGAQERELAARFGRFANVSLTTFPKVAKMLKCIATSYGAEAVAEDRRAQVQSG